MNPFDIAIIIIISFCLIRGAFRGLVKEASAIIGVMAGFYSAYSYYRHVAELLSDYITTTSYQNIAGFFLIFALVFITVSTLGVLIRYLLKIVFLGWVDRLCGAAFGLIKGYLITAVMLLALTSFLSAGSPLIKESRLCPYVLAATETMSVFVSKDMRDQFSSKIESIKKAWDKKGISIPWKK